MKEVIKAAINYTFGFLLCYLVIALPSIKREDLCKSALDSINNDLDNWIEYFESIPIDTVGSTYNQWQYDTIRI